MNVQFPLLYVKFFSVIYNALGNNRIWQFQSWDCAMFLSYVQGRYLQFLPFDQTVDWEAESILCADDQLHALNLGQWVFPSFFLRGEGISWRKMMPSRPLWGSWRRRTLLPFKSLNDVPKYNFSDHLVLLISSYK